MIGPQSAFAGAELHDEHVEAHAAHRKIVVTLQAKAAIAGFQLVALADGSFIASKWGLLKPLDGLDAVESFLTAAGVR